MNKNQRREDFRSSQLLDAVINTILNNFNLC